MTDLVRLERILRAEHACISMVTPEEDYALSLVRDAALRSGRSCVLWSIVGGLRDGLVAGTEPWADTENPAAALLVMGGREAADVYITLDLAGHLRDERTVRLLRELIRRRGQQGGTLVMIDHKGELPDVIAKESTPFEIGLPSEEELEQIIRDTIQLANDRSRIEANVSRGTLRTIVRNLRGLTRRQAERIILDCVIDDRRFDEDDLPTVLARKRQMLGREGLLEFVETPVDLGEIGGMKRLKSWLRLRQKSLSDEAVAFGISAPRGVLLLGVQGAGKSLCAKAVATAWQRPLLRMDVGALYDRYIGESERRLRDALRQAEAMSPIVLWIDEIEKAFASAASRNTDGGLSQRMFGSLLTWMQEHRAPVFLVATANDIEALPPELLRKGRFDEIFFVDLPSKASRRQIFAIHLRKRQRDPDRFDLGALVEASDGYSGAEIEQAVIAGLHDAFASNGELTTDHLLHALRDSPPLSVTRAEQVAALRQWAQQRCVPTD